jgi:hypothetical protein
MRMVGTFNERCHQGGSTRWSDSAAVGARPALHVLRRVTSAVNWERLAKLSLT